MGQPIPPNSLVHSRLVALGHGRVEALNDLARRGSPDFIGESLLLAIGLRETWLRNIVGDGGHGRGVFQMDDRWQTEWLRRRAGCRSGSFEFAHGHHAIEHGYVPGFTAGASRTIELLHGNYQYLRQHGLGVAVAERGAVAAFNCGAGNALAGYRRSGSVDAYTTGRDYSRWVVTVKSVTTTELKKLGWFEA